MDPNNLMLVPLASALTPVLVLLAIGLPIVGIYVANRYFGLRNKELELESSQNTRELVARVAALELRQGAVERAVTSLSGVRSDLLEAPPHPDSSPAAVPQRTRKTEL
jgi:hypothetical protein